MPTGYTAFIGDNNDVDVKQFMLNCSRAFGALIHMRDDSMKKEIHLPEVDPYYSDRLTEALENHQAFIKLSEDEVRAMYIEELSENKKKEEAYELEKKKLKAKYEIYLNAIIRWEPPTPDHNEYKNFMIDQITESIDFDCKSYSVYTIDISFEEWYDNKLDSLTRNVDYYGQEFDKHQKKILGARKWIKTLMESIENVDDD